MSTAVQAPPGAAGRRRIAPRAVLIALAVLVVAAMAVDTTYREPGETTATGRAAFDPAAYGAETYPKVQQTLQDAAVPIDELIPALVKDQEAASRQYGKRQGSSPYSFSTTGTGTAGKAENGLMPVEVDGLPKSTTVSVQVGPALNGTALRDAAGFIEFGQFTNQVEYADAATALNNEVKSKVLQGFDAAAAEGKQVQFSGAFSLITPDVVTITPTQLEVAG
jgi:predicted lipoprotein